jgi:hypothetical protein
MSNKKASVFIVLLAALFIFLQIIAARFGGGT